MSLWLSDACGGDISLGVYSRHMETNHTPGAPEVVINPATAMSRTAQMSQLGGEVAKALVYSLLMNRTIERASSFNREGREFPVTSVSEAVIALAQELGKPAQDLYSTLNKRG